MADKDILTGDPSQDENFLIRTFGDSIYAYLAKRQALDALHARPRQVVFRHEVPLRSQHVYGTGQRAFGLNLFGRRLTFWNTDAGAYHRGWEPINYTIPFLLNMHDEGVIAVFVDNTHRGTVDIGVANPNLAVFEFEGPARAVHTFQTATLDEAVARFCQLTGHMPMPPLWALGHHQSRYSYMNQDEVLAVAREFQSRGIPCDALYLDIHYMDNYKVFTWDKQAFPDLKGMIDELHSMGMRLVVILDPGVKIEPGYEGYESGLAQNVFITYPDGSPADGVVWPGPTHHPDFTRSSVRAWWAEQLQPLLEAGTDGLWNDMNEPLYFGNNEAISPADYLVHHTDEGVKNHSEMHNLYGHYMAMASRLAQTRHAPQRRPFVITRSGYAGTQAVSSSWTGDNRSTWDDLRIAIAMNLNMALSGQSFTGPDLGGFANDTNPELLVRWYQACVLFPFYRNHSAVDTVRQEPWAFGPETERILRDTIALRYRLLPYLYTCFAHCAHNGTPILRPLSAAEPRNPHIRSLDDAYLVGDKVLVAPVLEPLTLRRTVYLPAGSDWYTLDGTTKYPGGQLVDVAAPLDHVPMFVRAGTVLPTWPAQASSVLPAATTLRVYPGIGTSALYEDDGSSMAYETGAWRWVTFHCEGEKVRTEVAGSYPGTQLVYAAAPFV